MNSCKRCNQRILSHSKFLECFSCSGVFHLQCLPNVNSDDSIYTNRALTPWLCIDCSQDIFPFNHCSDNEHFVDELGTFFQGSPVILGSYDDLIFNPFELNDDDDLDLTPLSSIDPDLNYYNDARFTNIGHSCKYHLEDSFNKSLVNADKNAFSLFHSNIRSIPRHLDELKVHIDNLDIEFSVIGITESWLQEHNSALYNLENYKHFSRVRHSRSGGGVSLFIKDTISCRIIEEISLVNDIIECLFIEIKKSEVQTSQDVIVGVIYRPPNTDIRLFNDSLSEIIHRIHNNKLIYLLGDFNINLLNTDNHPATSEFVELMYSFSLFPLISKPTRIQQNSATLIDNIFSNQINCNLLNGILVWDVSDHYPIFVVDNNSSVQQTMNQHRFRDYSETNIRKFINEISIVNWTYVFQTPDCSEAFSLFYKKFRDIYNTCFPIKLSRSRYCNRKPWLTSALKQSIKIKNKLYVNSKKHPSEYNIRKYKMYKKRLQLVLSEAERNHIHTLLENSKSNIRKSWLVIKSVINKKISNGASQQFCINNSITSNKNIIAESFNDYFINIGNNLCKEISQSGRSPLSYMTNINVQDSLFLQPTDNREIESIIQLMNNSSPGYDDIQVKIIRKSYKSYIAVLVYLINLNMSHGKFPNELKTAKVIPIFKSGDDQLIKNYRPISVLPSFSKIFERVIYKRLYNFINRNDLLYRYQFGFRNSHSATLALTTLIDKVITGFNVGESTLGVFIDYSKAFDTVNHSILLDKLFKYGIRGISHDLISDYLCNRTQYVSYDNCYSSHKSITCGVPQGSILGPLLFLIYINDIYTVSESILPILFADDCNIFIQGQDLNLMTNVINNELQKLKLWIDTNMLSLNIDKTQYMIFSHKKLQSPLIHDVCISNKKIKFVNSIKFLGIMIDSKISWELHSIHIRKKISKGMGIISKAKKYLRKPTLLTLYNAFILPYITYGIEVWGSLIHSFASPIVILQKRILRIISSSSRLAPSFPLFQSSYQLPFYKLYTSKVFIFMYKVEKGIHPRIITDMFVKNENIHNLNTRHKASYRTPLFKSVKLQRNLRYRGVIYFNDISKIIDTNCSLHTVKKHLKLYLLNNDTCTENP